MKVILVADVKKLGQRGELKEVAEGYAQNVLLPKKLALPATAENLKVYTKKKALVDEKRQYEEGLLAKALLAVKGKEIVLPMKVNEAGRLFKTVTVSDVVKAIRKDIRIEVPEEVIRLPDSIKESGRFTMHLEGGGVTTTATLIVQSEK